MYTHDVVKLVANLAFMNFFLFAADEHTLI